MLFTMAGMEKTVYLSIGSNLGDRKANLCEAIARLGAIGAVTKVSSFYETEPVEVADQPWFLNCAVELRTSKMPRQLMSAVLNIERDMGRRRLVPKGPRLIDIDILLFGTSVIAIPGVTIPHPALHERRFVLEPLAQIAPGIRHPVRKQTAAQMRDALGSEQPVTQQPVVRKTSFQYEIERA